MVWIVLHMRCLLHEGDKGARVIMARCPWRVVNHAAKEGVVRTHTRFPVVNALLRQAVLGRRAGTGGARPEAEYLIKWVG